LNRLVERFGNRERLEGVAIYDSQGNVLASTPNLALKISKPFPQAISSITENRPIHSFLNIAGKEISLYILPLSRIGGGEVEGLPGEEGVIGTLALFHDASYIDVRLKGIWKNNILEARKCSIL
jgi:hypothetical protein